MAYYYGSPDNLPTWKDVVSIFAATHSLHSEKTSTLPLVQFWNPNDNGLEDVLVKACNLNITKKALREAKFCFEYPVPVHPKCGGRGKASMTDLMIITSSYAIALEAKYTEYLSGKQESISQWRNDPSLKDGTISANRMNVLQGWLNYISQEGYSEISQITEDLLAKLKDVPYQLFHRIASACAAAMGSKRKSVVIYQVFYDKKVEAEAEDFSIKLKEHFDVLEKWLRLQNVGFYVVMTPVKTKPESGTTKKDLGQLFLRMLEKDHGDIFEFGETQLKAWNAVITNDAKVKTL